jgi:hypothetical protein
VGTNTLAVVASENRKLKGSTGCSLFSQQRTLKRTDIDGLTTEKQEEKYEVQGTVQNSSNQSYEDARQKRSRTEDKYLVKVLYICEVNICGYTSECSNKIEIKSRTHELFTVTET